MAAIRGYLKPRLIVIFLMGFVSGLPLLLSGPTLQIWLTESGVSLAAVGLFALVGLPYTVKLLWAPFIDRVPVPILSRLLGRRRGWMVLLQILLMAAIVALGASDPVAAPGVTALLALIVAFFSASQDIVIDAYRIEILDEAEQGQGAAMTQAGYRVGLIAAGAGALYMAEVMAWSLVYGAMAALVLIGVAVAILAPEPPAGEAPEAMTPAEWLKGTIVDPFAEFFQRSGAKVALTILVFILLYKLGDAFAGVMANPFYIRIGFSKTEIASVSKIFGVVATLFGVFLGGAMVNRFGVLRSLLWCGLCQMFSNLMFAAQAMVGPDLGFLFLTIGIENLSAGLGSAAFVAYLSMLCNIHYTGTQYAAFTSFMAFGRTTLSAPTGYLVEATGWVTFFAASTVVALPGLLLLVWMMKRLPMERQGGRDAGAE